MHFNQSPLVVLLGEFVIQLAAALQFLKRQQPLAASWRPIGDAKRTNQMTNSHMHIFFKAVH